MCFSADEDTRGLNTCGGGFTCRHVWITEPHTGLQSLTIAGWRPELPQKSEITPLQTVTDCTTQFASSYLFSTGTASSCTSGSFFSSKDYSKIPKAHDCWHRVRKQSDRQSITIPPNSAPSPSVAPTLLVLVYSVHITLLLFWLALFASICDFGTSDQNVSNKGSVQTLGEIRTNP